jgi:transposase
MIGDKWLSIRNDKKKGLSYSEIARKYNIDRRTAKKYCESNVKPDYKYNNPRKKKIDAYEPYIDGLLSEAPYSAVRIQELVEEHFNIKIGYTTIQEYVKKTKHNYNHQATVRFETMPGFYGNEKKLYCFLMILGYSRMRYIEFVTDMSTQTLIRCHLNAFDYFGGYPEEILYDNMKQVVVKRLLKQKDSTLNKTFEDFAGFFNFKPILCRPYRGQTKGKIERTVRYVRENFMIGIKYKNLEDLNKQAYTWCEKVNNKIHSTTNEIPKVRLLEEHLTKVTRPYFIDVNTVRKVEKDCLFSYKGNKYSVPPKYIYRYVIVAGFDNLLQVYCDGEKIATHPIAKGKNIAVISKYHYDSISHSHHDKDHNSIFDDANYDEKLSNVNLEVYNYE